MDIGIDLAAVGGIESEEAAMAGVDREVVLSPRSSQLMQWTSEALSRNGKRATIWSVRWDR